MNDSKLKIKFCIGCRRNKSVDEFSPNSGHKDGLQSRCNLCRRKKYVPVNRKRRRFLYNHDEDYRKRSRAAAEKYRRNNRKKYLEASRKRKSRIRLEVIRKYGNKCRCCGETQIEFLTIDHILNDGALERHRRGGTSSIYIRLYSKPVDRRRYQVLCFNCNCSKGAYGYCPHKS